MENEDRTWDIYFSERDFVDLWHWALNHRYRGFNPDDKIIQLLYDRLCDNHYNRGDHGYVRINLNKEEFYQLLDWTDKHKHWSDEIDARLNEMIRILYDHLYYEHIKRLREWCYDPEFPGILPAD